MNCLVALAQTSEVVILKKKKNCIQLKVKLILNEESICFLVIKKQHLHSIAVVCFTLFPAKQETEI